MAPCRQRILGKSNEEESKSMKKCEKAVQLNCVYSQPQIKLFQVEGQVLWLTLTKITLKFTEDNGIIVV